MSSFADDAFCLDQFAAAGLDAFLVGMCTPLGTVYTQVRIYVMGMMLLYGVYSVRR